MQANTETERPRERAKTKRVEQECQPTTPSCFLAKLSEVLPFHPHTLTRNSFCAENQTWAEDGEADETRARKSAILQA